MCSISGAVTNGAWLLHYHGVCTHRSTLTRGVAWPVTRRAASRHSLVESFVQTFAVRSNFCDDHFWSTGWSEVRSVLRLLPATSNPPPPPTGPRWSIVTKFMMDKKPFDLSSFQDGNKLSNLSGSWQQLEVRKLNALYFGRWSSDKWITSWIHG